MNAFTEEKIIISNIPHIDYFLIRNYRKRLFQKSAEYKKYCEHTKKIFEIPELVFGVSTIEEERRVFNLFSKIIGENFNDWCKEEYGLDLIDLMTEDCITDLLYAYKAGYNDIFKDDISKAIHICSNIFYVPIVHYISADNDENLRNSEYDGSDYTQISINILNNNHCNLIELIGDKTINLSEIEDRDEFKDIYYKVCEEISIKNPKKCVLYIEKENWYENEESMNTALLPMESKFYEMSFELKELSKDCLKEEKKISKLKTLIYDYTTSMEIKKKLFEYNFQSYLKQQLSHLDSETIFFLKKVQDKNTNLSDKIDSLLNFPKDNLKLYEKILISLGISHATTTEIKEQDKPQITEELKTRIIGLHLYDVVDEEKSTVPVQILKNDPILREFGYTEDDKQKLNNYLKTARRCVKYGMILPIKS